MKGLKEIHLEGEESEEEEAFRGGKKKKSMFADLQEFEDLLDQEEISPEAFKKITRSVGKTRKARGN